MGTDRAASPGGVPAMGQRRVLLAAAAALALVSASARAQPVSPDAAGRARGASDGASQGAAEGAGRGRSEMLVDEWVRGFRYGLLDPVDRRATEEAWADGREASWSSGHEAA